MQITEEQLCFLKTHGRRVGSSICPPWFAMTVILLGVKVEVELKKSKSRTYVKLVKLTNSRVRSDILWYNQTAGGWNETDNKRDYPLCHI